MKKYLLKRLLTLIPVLFIVSLVIFTLIHLTPGDPARIMLGDQASEAEVQVLREKMGFNAPLPVQYLNWVKKLLQGNFGQSVFMEGTMTEIIASHLAPTLLLTFYALLIAVAVAVPLGILAARTRGTAADHVISGLSMSGISVPSFLLGLFLILLFAVKLGWLPAAGYKGISEAGFLKNLRYMIMPAIALGCMQAGLIIRMTRSSVLEVLNCDYIKMARAKGVKERVIILKHAFKNALLPIITVIGQGLMSLLSGAAVVESVFNIPGIGQLIINSVSRRDYEVIQAIVLFVALVNVLICLLIDLLYGLADPRVRLEG